MNDYSLLLLYTLLGQIMPPLTDVINKQIPSSKLRFWISMFVCFVISIAFNYSRLTLGGINAILTDALVIWGSGQAAYKMYYDGSTQQQNIRFSASAFPVKQLLPDISGLLKKDNTPK